MSGTPERSTVVQPTDDDGSIVDSELPGEIQTQLERLLPDDEPTTFRDLVGALSERLDVEGGILTVDDFQVDDPDVGAVEFETSAIDSDGPDGHGTGVEDESLEFCCVPNSLLTSFVTGESVDITSECPQAGTEITLEVTSSGIEATPAESVISFGVSTDLPDRDFAESDEDLYEQLCPYVIPFSSGDAYEQWAEETTEAETVALPVEEAYAVAREAHRAAERSALNSSMFDCSCC